MVDPRESLGRYLPEESYFSRSKNAVKPKAFMPPSDLKLSVFRIDGLSLKQIWEIGEQQVIQAMPQTKVLYGLANIKVAKVNEVSLSIDPDNRPMRHANIIGWPANKARRQSIAQELAAEAKLVLKGCVPYAMDLQYGSSSRLE